jgi:hypothetical protein
MSLSALIFDVDGTLTENMRPIAPGVSWCARSTAGKPVHLHKTLPAQPSD